jgi:hypothetical protein
MTCELISAFQIQMR